MYPCGTSEKITLHLNVFEVKMTQYFSVVFEVKMTLTVYGSGFELLSVRVFALLR